MSMKTVRSRKKNLKVVIETVLKLNQIDILLSADKISRKVSLTSLLNIMNGIVPTQAKQTNPQGTVTKGNNLKVVGEQ